MDVRDNHKVGNLTTNTPNSQIVKRVYNNLTVYDQISEDTTRPLFLLCQ